MFAVERDDIVGIVAETDEDTQVLIDATLAFPDSGSLFSDLLQRTPLMPSFSGLSGDDPRLVVAAVVLGDQDRDRIAYEQVARRLAH